MPSGANGRDSGLRAGWEAVNESVDIVGKTPTEFGLGGPGPWALLPDSAHRSNKLAHRL